MLLVWIYSILAQASRLGFAWAFNLYAYVSDALLSFRPASLVLFGIPSKAKGAFFVSVLVG